MVVALGPCLMFINRDFVKFLFYFGDKISPYLKFAMHLSEIVQVYFIVSLCNKWIEEFVFIYVLNVTLT